MSCTVLIKDVKIITTPESLKVLNRLLDSGEFSGFISTCLLNQANNVALQTFEDRLQVKLNKIDDFAKQLESRSTRQIAPSANVIEHRNIVEQKEDFSADVKDVESHPVTSASKQKKVKKRSGMSVFKNFAKKDR